MHSSPPPSPPGFWMGAAPNPKIPFDFLPRQRHVRFMNTGSHLQRNRCHAGQIVLGI